jgi:hypothetical protein
MKRAAVLGALGAGLLALGIYLFPLGQDAFFALTTNMAGGDYWTGIAYAYVITIGLIVAGLAILRPALARTLLRPPFLAALAIGAVVIFLAGGF